MTSLSFGHLFLNAPSEDVVSLDTSSVFRFLCIYLLETIFRSNYSTLEYVFAGSRHLSFAFDFPAEPFSDSQILYPVLLNRYAPPDYHIRKSTLLASSRISCGTAYFHIRFYVGCLLQAPLLPSI